MKFTSDELDIAFAIRQRVGANSNGGGVSTMDLLQLERVNGKDPAKIRIAIDRLADLGYVRLSTCIGGTAGPNVPPELADIAKVSIQEPMQQWFDDAGIP